MQAKDVQPILLTVGGSFAYGTATPTSDVDVRGIFAAPRAYRDGFCLRVEQVEDKAIAEGFAPHLPPHVQAAVVNGLDSVVFEIRKFMKLAADANPNILEVLFGEPFYEVPAGALLRAHRKMFLSQRCVHTYAGYAHSQWKRIKSHRAWLLDPPKAKPTRAEFGLAPEPLPGMAVLREAVQKQVDSWKLDFGDLGEAEKRALQEDLVERIANIDDAVVAVRAAAAKIGVNSDLSAALQAELAFHNATRQWSQYETWKAMRNPARAELEARFGYDTKHGMHLCRLMLQLEQILATGDLPVRLDQEHVEWLQEVRQGRLSYEGLTEWFAAQEARSKALRELNPAGLPRVPPMSKLDDLCMEVYQLEDARRG